MNITTFTAENNENVEEIDDDLHQLSIYELTMWCFLYTLIAFLAVFGNILVVYITIKPLYNKSVTNLLIINLAIADIITGTLAIPFKFHAALFQRWFWPDIFCKIVPFIETLSLSVSVFTLCTSALSELSQLYFIKIDAMNLHSARKLIFIIWFLAFIVSLPYGMFHDVITFKLSSNSTDNIRQCIPKYGDENWWKAYNIYLTIIHYFVPLIIVDSAYTIIAINVYRGTQQKRNLTSFMKKVSECNSTVTSKKNFKIDEEDKNGHIKLLSNSQHAKLFPATSQQSIISINHITNENTVKSRRKIVTILILVVTFFTLCWLPLETYLLLNEVLPQINEWRYINVLFFCCHWLAMSNSCFNPIIYGLYNDKYKQEYRKIFSRLFGICCKKFKNNRGDFQNCQKKYSLASKIIVKNITNNSSISISNYETNIESINEYNLNKNCQIIESIDKNLPLLQNASQNKKNLSEDRKEFFDPVHDIPEHFIFKKSEITNEFIKTMEIEQTFLMNEKETSNDDCIL